MHENEQQKDGIRYLYPVTEFDGPHNAVGAVADLRSRGGSDSTRKYSGARWKKTSLSK